MYMYPTGFRITSIKIIDITVLSIVILPFRLRGSYPVKALRIGNFVVLLIWIQVEMQ